MDEPVLGFCCLLRRLLRNDEDNEARMQVNACKFATCCSMIRQRPMAPVAANLDAAKQALREQMPQVLERHRARIR